MKKIIKVLAPVILVMFSSCGNAPGSEAGNPGASIQTRNKTAEPTPLGREQATSSPRVLEDWDLALYSFGGMPSVDTQITLKNLERFNKDTPARVPGPYPETEIWTWAQGLSALVKPQEDNVLSVEIQKPGMTSGRNVSVGDSREKVRLAYGLGSHKPEDSVWVFSPNYAQRPYPANQAWRQYLSFTFVEGKVSKIKVYDQLD